MTWASEPGLDERRGVGRVIAGGYRAAVRKLLDMYPNFEAYAFKEFKKYNFSDELGAPMASARPAWTFPTSQRLQTDAPIYGLSERRMSPLVAKPSQVDIA